MQGFGPDGEQTLPGFVSKGGVVGTSALPELPAPWVTVIWEVTASPWW